MEVYSWIIIGLSQQKHVFCFNENQDKHIATEDASWRRRNKTVLAKCGFSVEFTIKWYFGFKSVLSFVHGKIGLNS